MKILLKILFFIFCLNSLLFANRDSIESQPEIIFQFDKLRKTQENLQLQVDFNKAVLFLSKGQYEDSIKLFEKTLNFLELPSILNIAIAYYKLNSIDNAVIYFNKIYENEQNINTDSYSYMSAAYYLYQISKDNKYLDKIINISKKFKELSEHSKRMLADTYIILKEYKEALVVLESMDYAMDLKKALILIKLKDYDKARILLTKAKETTTNPNTVNKILWFLTFVNLKTNKLELLKENLDEVYKRRNNFKANFDLPLEIYFNKNKFTPQEYLDLVLKFDNNRQIDFVFYFAPFIFSDSQEIIYDTVKGFIYDQKKNIQNLEEMVAYNANFLNVVKKDPISRVVELRKMLKNDSKSYVYYNYALACTHINDFNNAFKYFEKAYKLNPGNKLYSSMVLLSSIRINKRVKDKEYIENNLKTPDGMYNYFGKNLYKFFVNNGYSFNDEPRNYEDTVFFKAIDFLKNMNNGESLINHSLLDEHFKDPFTYLLRLVQKRDKESDFNYFSRLQDTIPLTLNNNFLEGPSIISRYYIEILKATGLFYNADFTVIGRKTPTYLKTKALRDLYMNKSKESIKTIEYLQNEYKIEDRDTMYLLVASLLQEGRYNDASIQISLIKAILNDQDADFLTAVQLIQELKITSAKQYLNYPYKDSLIDFRLVGFDEYLESL